MKIRNGFVSNSSSSSFIIFAKQVAIQDIKDNDNIYGYNNFDSYCSDGEDFFEVDKEMIDYFKKKSDNSLTFYNVFLMIQNTIISKKELLKSIKAKNFSIFAIDLSYHATENLEEYIERYVK